MTVQLELIYFDIRGRAECIRLLLEEVGLVYDDRQITNVEWQELKPGMPFGQVPVVRIGSVELVQTQAIMRHLARAHDLCGESEPERTRCDTAVEAIRDADNHLGAVVWRPGFEEDRSSIIENEFPERLIPLESFFAGNPSGAPFWAGASLTFADIMAFDFLENTEALFPGALAATRKLSEFRDQIAQRPNIAAYLQSGRRPDAIMYGPRRDRHEDSSTPGPMNSSLRKIYPAALTDTLDA